MNDPGLADAIERDSKAVEGNLHDMDPGIGGEEEEAAYQEDVQLANDSTAKKSEEDFLLPNWYWMFSTAFPLIAGTFGPMASAFSICALVQSWRVAIPDGGTEGHGIKVPDPPWLLAINAVSLVIALTSNLSLLLNMARRVPFRIAQPVTIIGWFVSSFLLIGLVAAAPKIKFSLVENRALTQAFYYGIIAAALYFIVASLMLCTAWGAYYSYYPREFQLTMSQRTLMLQTIVFLVYLLAGSAIYAHIEQWEFLDAIFWSDFTLLTIGIGDYLVPKTHLGRGLLFPYAVGGIIILGLVIGSIRSLVLERAATKMGNRMLEVRREKAIKKMKPEEKKRLEPITHTQTREERDISEHERRKAEFELMRHLQESAHREKRWVSLLISAMVWLALWFLGALTFFYSEKDQQWSYFQSLYFAYTSLLTIGYGDFTLLSNSGKPFFVFWSLCAVPALTILISNMGDTLIKGIKDGTIWLGNVTVLPGESPIMDTLRHGASKITRRRFTDRDDHQDKEKQLVDPPSETASEEIEFEALQVNVAHRHYLIAKEIRRVLEHVHSGPRRKYSYAEWTWYLRLIGEDEASERTHRAPMLNPTHGVQDATTHGEGDEVKKWSWMGHRSPLMGGEGESEWILSRLTVTLEELLHKHHLEHRKDHDKKPSL